MKPSDDDTTYNPPAESVMAEFKRQMTAPLLTRIKAFATARLAGFGRGAPIETDRAQELAAAAAHDTLCGRVTWNPERRGLEAHLQDVIDRRLWLDWDRAKKFRHESIDAAADDERSTT